MANAVSTDRLTEQSNARRRKNWIVLGGIVALMGFFYWLTIHRITESIAEGERLRNAQPAVEAPAEGAVQPDAAAPVDGAPTEGAAE